RKAEIVRELQAQGRRVAFAGDGINDAPALAQAQIGFAMGSGTAVALETAGAALLRNDPRAVASAIAVARATMRTGAQNLVWAFGYNVILVPLAAFGIVQPVLAAGAMGLSSLFVVGNSLRLTRRSTVRE
ncbi:MAG: HAD-IC family P-type ATPase, partial [Candidatus Aquilonibacter sp.]